MSNFYIDIIQKDSRFNSTKIINDMELLEPTTRQIVEIIIADAKAHGLNLMVFETYRSQARQTLLYNQRATQLKTVGVHHYGLACDIVKVVGGNPSWKGDFSFLGALAHAHKLIWGGDWGTPNIHHNFLDVYHVQRCSIGRQGSLFRGEWYPDENYDPYNEGFSSFKLAATIIPDDLTEQFDRAKANNWLDYFIEAAHAHNWTPELLLGIASRESNIRSILGDAGHGYGIMQIDDRSFPDFCNSSQWKDAQANINFGAKVLSGKRNVLSQKGVSEPILTRASVAAYNCGEGNVWKAISQGKDIDIFTAHQNYSSDVMSRTSTFAELLQTIE